MPKRLDDRPHLDAYDRSVNASTDVRDAARAVMDDVARIDVVALAGGSSAFVARLDLESSGRTRRSVVFRQHTDRAAKVQTEDVAAKEFHLMTELAGAGFEVPRPIALHGPQPTDGPWLVTEWVEGSTDVSDHDIESALSQMADFLTRLHALDPLAAPAAGLKRIEDPLAELPQNLTDSDVADRLREAIGNGISLQPNADALLHGDFWPGNVMFDHDGRLSAVLDWEDAQIGDPLADLATARVELTCAYGEAACIRFTEQYVDLARTQMTALELHDLPVWDAYVSATALAAMHRWGLSPDVEASRRATTSDFLASAATRLSGRA